MIKLDVDRLRINLLKKIETQTVKHILNLLTCIINYGTKNNLCEGVSFHIQKPSVNNQKTENLSPEQLERLLEAIENDGNRDAGRIMKMPLGYFQKKAYYHNGFDGDKLFTVSG